MKKVKKMITALAKSILVLGCNKYRKNYNLQKGHHWPCPKRPRSFYELYNLNKQQKGR